ncbi:ornithine carbamoyltransferase [Paenisporosarcina sp. OV554]|uniref:ornithine carbamoyltransferase n=1 Tax=Paenisporosarcina sp. OV554 TaxID=2135694 RepID=UPI000D3D9DBB|nr:ornithine carbamoyltransferase [Paenisporosarcina sp. OV554]PUB15128.1 ornithine carbamoyltransferase [Paenisporosarcina sp. OV554]
MKLLEYVNLEVVKSVRGKDLLTWFDYSSEEVKGLLDLAVQLKSLAKNGVHPPLLLGKTVGLIFEKHSTRTRISFEVGMNQLGGHAMYMHARDLQIGRGEPISDTGKVLSGYLDGIMIRANSHKMVEELAYSATIPVINGLTDLYHPCQALADLLTIHEVKGNLPGQKLAYVGDGNNVAHSLIIACAHLGVDVSIASPTGFEIDSNILAKAQQLAASNGSTIMTTTNPIEAVKNADVIYTDVWTSMGQEEETAARLQAFERYQINEELVQHAKSNYLFLHCLPAHREEEVATSIIDGQHSAVFQQAENRLHAQKAILASILA